MAEGGGETGKKLQKNGERMDEREGQEEEHGRQGWRERSRGSLESGQVADGASSVLLQLPGGLQVKALASQEQAG